MIALTIKNPVPNCTTLSAIYPPIHKKTHPGLFWPLHLLKGYHCFKFTANSPKNNYGEINHDWCNVTDPVDTTTESTQTV